MHFSTPDQLHFLQLTWLFYVRVRSLKIAAFYHAFLHYKKFCSLMYLRTMKSQIHTFTGIGLLDIENSLLLTYHNNLLSMNFICMTVSILDQQYRPPTSRPFRLHCVWLDKRMLARFLIPFSPFVTSRNPPFFHILSLTKGRVTDKTTLFSACIRYWFLRTVKRLPVFE